METFEVVDCATGEAMQITCNADMAARAQSDENYLMQLLNQQNAQSQEGENLHTHIAISDDESTSQGKKWDDSATLLLISLLKETKGKVGQTFKFKTRKKQAEFIAAAMSKKGHSFSASQVDNKSKGLEKSFRNVTNHNNKTGNNRMTCPFFNELYDLFKDRASMYPEFVLGASGSGTHLDVRTSPSTSSQVPSGSGTQLQISPVSSNSKVPPVGRRPPLLPIQNEESYDEDNDFHSESLMSPRQQPRQNKRKMTKEEIQENRWQEKMEVMRDRNRILERELMRKNDILQEIADSLKPKPK